jgi:hypothetical protein
MRKRERKKERERERKKRKEKRKRKRERRGYAFDATTTPQTRSLCPFKYFVALFCFKYSINQFTHKHINTNNKKFLLF